MSQEVKRYDYFAAPDGYDVFNKFIYLLKPATLISISLSMVDTLCLSHPKGYLATIGRYVYVSAPVYAATAAFVGVSNISGSIRKKDDGLNWLAGGFAAGSLLGAYLKSYKVGCIAGTAFGVIAFGVKTADLKNFPLYKKKIVIAEGGARSHKFDWTLTQERPRNWVAGERD